MSLVWTWEQAKEHGIERCERGRVGARTTGDSIGANSTSEVIAPARGVDEINPGRVEGGRGLSGDRLVGVQRAGERFGDVFERLLRGRLPGIGAGFGLLMGPGLDAYPVTEKSGVVIEREGASQSRIPFAVFGILFERDDSLAHAAESFANTAVHGDPLSNAFSMFRTYRCDYSVGPREWEGDFSVGGGWMDCRERPPLKKNRARR